MNESKTKDKSKIKFSSTVFPTKEDLALWNSLSEDERQAFLEQEEEKAFLSGTAPFESKEEILARVRAEKAK